MEEQNEVLQAEPDAVQRIFDTALAILLHRHPRKSGVSGTCVYESDDIRRIFYEGLVEAGNCSYEDFERLSSDFFEATKNGPEAAGDWLFSHVSDLEQYTPDEMLLSARKFFMLAVATSIVSTAGEDAAKFLLPRVTQEEIWVFAEYFREISRADLFVVANRVAVVLQQVFNNHACRLFVDTASEHVVH